MKPIVLAFTALGFAGTAAAQSQRSLEFDGSGYALHSRAIFPVHDNVATATLANIGA